MITKPKLTYDDFILLNDHLSFHPGGLIATFNILSNIPNLSKKRTVLDYGCGNGTTLAFLKKLGFKNLIGFDRNTNAIELNESKWPDIKFYSNYDEISKSDSKVDVLLLESVFSFNGAEDLKYLLITIQKLIQKTGVKQIAIVDFYATDKIPDELREKMIDTFNIQEIRTKNEFEEIINSIKPDSTITYFKEHIFFLNLKDKYDPKEQAIKLMNSKLLSHDFNSQMEAQTFFNKFIPEMLSSYSYFTDHFKYFECVITL